MFSYDIEAFKKHWYTNTSNFTMIVSEIYGSSVPHLIQFMGTSQANEEYPYIVLRGGELTARSASPLTFYLFTVPLVTSDHVSIYLAGKFREDNERGSAYALKFVRACPHLLHPSELRNTNIKLMQLTVSAAAYHLIIR